ncbi:MAG: hypothetical protein ACW7DQ_04355, partial [Paraglaciecola chathamensis]
SPLQGEGHWFKPSSDHHFLSFIPLYKNTKYPNSTIASAISIMELRVSLSVQFTSAFHSPTF